MSVSYYMPKLKDLNDQLLGCVHYACIQVCFLVHFTIKADQRCLFVSFNESNVT